MKSDDGAGNGSTVPSATGAFASVVPIGSTVEKRASVDEGSSLRKRSRRGTSEQLADSSGSTTRVPVEKENRQQRTQAWGPQDALAAAVELHVKELEEDTNKLRDELESLKSQRRDLEQEVRVLRSSLDGAWNDRAHLEGDVLSLTKAAALLKAEGPRAVAAYKVSQGFESGPQEDGEGQLRVRVSGDARTALGEASRNNDRAEPIRRVSRRCQCRDGPQPDL
ncbi:hypothetical protein GW17_00035024 [Ensete ventricosum]|nr:hypothetical protein GW17_00035024 [Ensete ventricosum]